MTSRRCGPTPQAGSRPLLGERGSENSEGACDVGTGLAASTARRPRFQSNASGGDARARHELRRHPVGDAAAEAQGYGVGQLAQEDREPAELMRLQLLIGCL